ncbi:MAG: hypothetical protein ACHQNA_03185 [Acidimicrobiales bacterium]
MCGVMLDVHFVIVGALIGGAGQALYVRDTILGHTRPNRVTWLLWTVAPLIAFAAELNAGVGLRALLPFTAGFGPLVIFTATFIRRADSTRPAVWRISRLDAVCGALSVLGVIGWIATQQGLVAIASSIAADALAWVPTIVKSWSEPESESASVFVGGLANSTITLLTVDRLTAAVVAFPVYTLAVAITQLVLVAGRLGPRLVARSTLADE